MFKKGNRDESLFHVANCLIKGGMQKETARNVLTILALQCDPPFPEKEIPVKIKSALNRKESSDRNLSEEVREFVLTSSGDFLTPEIYNRLQVTSRSEKKAIVKELLRLKDKGVIERAGKKNGCYRRVESDCEPEDWHNAPTDTVNLWLPFGLDDFCMIMPGDIILIAGSQNAGKSALMMNIAKENRDNYMVHYFSSELRPGSFKRRMAKFPNISPDELNINFYQRSSNFADVIKPGSGNLNLVDYIELSDKFYQIAGILSKLHDKLDGALIVAAIQKDPNALYGRGGAFTQEKPVLSLAVDNGVMTISKLKEWDDTKTKNPNGMQCHFKIIDGCRLIKKQHWHKPVKPTVD